MTCIDLIIKEWRYVSPCPFLPKWATSTSVSFMPFGSFKILCKNRLQLCNVLVGNVFFGDTSKLFNDFI